MQRCFINNEKNFSKVALTVLFLSIFALLVMTAPAAKAQGITVTLTPSSGPPGTEVIVQASNYPSGDTWFSVTFGSTPEPSIATGSFDNTGTAALNVPAVDVGKYTVTVTDQNGVSGTATFTVTQPPTVVLTPAPTGTSTETSPGTGTSSTAPSGTSPTYYPVTPYSPIQSKSGFWSPLVIGIVAFVAAVACFTTVVFVRRGRQGPELVSVEDKSGYRPSSSVENTQPYTSRPTGQETSPYGYRPSAQQASPYGYRSSTQQTSPYGYRSPTQQTSPYGYRSYTQQTSPYGYRSSVPPTSSAVSPQLNQTVTNRPQPPAHTKMCKHCKRDVREDLRVCPYCYKKL